MKKKQEKARIRKQGSSMKEHLKSFFRTHHQEDLHQFRVEVKKLRSWLMLLGAEQDRQLMRPFKEIRKVYRKAGVIRDTHLHLQLSSHYHLHNWAFEEEQHKKARRKIRSFSRDSHRHIRTIEKAGRKLRQHVPRLDHHRIGRFYEEHIAAIAAFLADIRFNEALHDSRKRMKYLLHNEKIARKAFPGLPVINVPYLDHLQELIGRWHDNVLSVQLFSSLDEANGPVIDRIRAANESLEGEIREAADGFAVKIRQPPRAVKQERPA